MDTSLHIKAACPIRCSRATSGPGTVLERSAALCANLILQAGLFSLLQKNVIVISSAALQASVAHSVDFKILP
jgi:hypothetical protein